MTMSIKKITAAMMLSMAAFGAQAALLDSLGGAKTWHISGLSAENSLTGKTATIEGQTVNATFGNSLGWETTWLVGTVESIFENPISSSNTWNAGEGGTYLNYMIYGVADAGAQLNGGTYDLYNTGATKDAGSDGKIHIDVYRSSASINLNNIKASDRHDYNQFYGLTDTGSLYLSLTMEAEYFSGDAVTSLFQQVSALQLPAKGDGFFYANVDTSTGASGNIKWNTNGVDNDYTAGFDGFDFGGAYTLRTIGTAQSVGLLKKNGQGYFSEGFAGYISDPLSSNAIPEPGSMALVGLGLMGLAGLRRRKLPV